MKFSQIFKMLAFLAFAVPLQLFAATEKSDILVMWGDDAGVCNTGVYNRDGTGYKTPNIDSIVRVHCLPICICSSPVRRTMPRSSLESILLERGI